MPEHYEFHSEQVCSFRLHHWPPTLSGALQVEPDFPTNGELISIVADGCRWHRFVIVKVMTNQLLEHLPPTTIGLGTAALGRPAYITTSHGSDLSGRADKAAMEANAMEVFDFAHANGVRYFDAARSYGIAEQFLSHWSARSNPSDIVVGSKWGYTLSLIHI